MKGTVTNPTQDEHANVVELTDGELATVMGGSQSATNPYNNRRYNDHRYYNDHRHRYNDHRHRYNDHRHYNDHRYGH